MSGVGTIDWDAFTRRFQEVEVESDRNEYVEASDAASLSSCFLPDEETAVGSPFIRRPELRGLSRLVLRLTSLLNEAHIAQQSTIAELKADCTHIAKVAGSAALNTPAPLEEASSTPRIPQQQQQQQTTTVRGGSLWASLPSADDEDIDGLVADKPPSVAQRLASGLFSGLNSRTTTQSTQDTHHQRVDGIARQLRRQIQTVHDRAIELVDAKLKAYEILRHCEKFYARNIIALAVQKGVSRPAARVSLLMEATIVSLRAHKFLDTSEAEGILSFTRELHASAFLDSRKALSERRLLLTQNTDSAWLSSEQSRLNIRIGAGLTLLAWALSECFNNESAGREIWHDPTFAIFMCFGDLLLLLWMWGVSMQVWRSAGIDFVRLLQLQETEVGSVRTPEVQVYKSATTLSLIFLGVFICFNKAVRGVLHVEGSLFLAHTLPTLLVVFFLYRIASPIHSRRRWLGFLWEVLAAPFYPVGFRDGYIGDLLTSLVRVLIPMSFSFAYLFTSVLAWFRGSQGFAASTSDTWWQDSAFFRLFLVPFLTLFPLWIRLMQCLRRSVETGKRWPHMANGLKYTSAIVVIALGTLRPSVRQNPLWVLGFVFATLYQFTWDLAMDWGIVVPASSPGASSLAWGGLALRRVRLLGGLGVYTAVISANLLLRFAWTLTLLPTNVGDPTSLYSVAMAYLGPLIAAAEILRRMVWGFFRLEHEQLEVIGAVGAAASTSALGGGAPKNCDGHGQDIGMDMDDDEELDEERTSLAPVEFERMGLAAAGGRSSETWDPVAAFTTSVFSARGIPACFERDWLPLPELVVVFAARFSWLDRHASLAAKYRLLEAEIFAAVVLGFIILVAASA